MSSEPASITSLLWTGRPPGLPRSTPPPSVPLTFFGAAFVGLVACGIILILADNIGIANPTSDSLIAAACVGMLTTLSMGVLGAIHQFTPVVTQRPLRSVLLAWITFVAWLAAAWLLPLGVGTRYGAAVEAGGGFALITATILTVNLWTALRVKGKGAPVIGLRFAVAGFIATACFGVVYVTHHLGNWFDLSGHVMLADATIGLFAWLGLTWVSIGEKRWPLFFLAHVPRKRRSGLVAVSAIPLGIVLLSPGFLFEIPFLAWTGGAIISLGLGSHLLSLATHLCHKKRGVDLYLVFAVTATFWMAAGLVLAAAAGLVISRDYHFGVLLAATSVAAFTGWILEAFVGHVYKVIPFVFWSMFRERGTEQSSLGKQPVLDELYDHWMAALVYGFVTTGVGSVCMGLAISVPTFLVVGGSLLVLSGGLLGINLLVRSIHMLRANTATIEPSRMEDSLNNIIYLPIRPITSSEDS